MEARLDQSQSVIHANTREGKRPARRGTAFASRYEGPENGSLEALIR